MALNTANVSVTRTHLAAAAAEVKPQEVDAPWVDEVERVPAPQVYEGTSEISEASVQQQPQQAVQLVTEEHAIAAARPASFGGSFEDAGLGGLEVGFHSFPMIKLETDGIFRDTALADYGKEFRCYMQSSKSKIAYSAGNNDKNVIFTDDDRTTTKGQPLHLAIAELEAKLGAKLVRREYVDVVVVMIAPGMAHDGEVRILSVSPTGRQRLGGAVMTLSMRKAAPMRSEKFQQVLTSTVLRCGVGARVTDSAHPFYPWDFKFEI